MKLEADPKFVLDTKLLALRVLIALPLATISAFGFASLALYRRLFEEYNHKQRVMELYESFKNEIETEGDEDQKKKLLSIMLDSVADKAWQGIVSVKSTSPAVSVPTIDEVVESLEKMKALLGK